MARKRQARRCSASRSDGSPCGGWAINGGTVCRTHGGAAPQVRARAAEKVAEAKLERLLYRYQAPPCSDPIEALQQLVGRALAMESAIGEMVNGLQGIRYTDGHGAEQLRAEVVVLERAMDRAGRLLVDVARLNIEERIARVTEAQAQMAMDALSAAMGEMGMSAEQQREACSRVGRHLRPVPILPA